MQIHRVASGETLDDIAKIYEISPDRIRENNTGVGLSPKEGRELLILRPTRTYTAKDGDTPRSIACRFGIKTHDFLKNNPSLCTSELTVGREYAVKYPTPRGGTAAANGYFYKGTKTRSLSFVLPYITYLTLGAYKLAPNGSPVQIFDPTEVLKIAKRESKVPLMRVYDGTDSELYKSPDGRRGLSESLVGLAKSLGFSGITLAAFKSAKKYGAEYAEFLMELRRNMIGCDLILFTECDEETPLFVAELADGNVFMYDKCGKENPPSFAGGEVRVLTEFADSAESSKAMIYLDSHAWRGGECVPFSSLERSLFAGDVEFDRETLLCRAKIGGVNTVFESLENTKAKLTLADELGYSGIAFDISGIRREELMLFSALFSPIR